MTSIDYIILFGTAFLPLTAAMPVVIVLACIGIVNNIKERLHSKPTPEPTKPVVCEHKPSQYVFDDARCDYYSPTYHSHQPIPHHLAYDPNKGCSVWVTRDGERCPNEEEVFC